MNILAFCSSLVCLITTIDVKRKNKLINPSTIFYALWTFILFLSILNLYGIYKPSDEAYLLIMIMIVSFYLGNLIFKIIKEKFLNSGIKNNEKNKKYYLLDKVFLFLGFSVILFNLIDLIIIIKQLADGTPMWQIRNWTLEPVGSNNPILSRRSFAESCFRNIILEPFAALINPIALYYVFYGDNKKKKILFLVISILTLITSSLAGGGGRLGFICFIACLIFAFYVAIKDGKISKEYIKKYSKILLVIMLVALIIITLYTTIRTGPGKLIKQTYTYFALPPTLLSEWLPQIKNTEYTYGMTTFFGIHSYCFRVLETFKLKNMIPEVYERAYKNILNAEQFKDVGSGKSNAFVSPVYYLYLDGGYSFVFIMSCMFGFLIEAIYQKLKEDINVKSFTIYYLIFYGVFVTFIRIRTAIPSYIISFIFANLIIRSKKEEKDDKCSSTNIQS